MLNPITTVNGRSGAVVLAESDVPGLSSALAALAPLASPALTGTPTAPTPAAPDSSTTFATTAFVKAQGYLTAAPVTSVAGRTGAVTLSTADVTGLGTAATHAAGDFLGATATAVAASDLTTSVPSGDLWGGNGTGSPSAVAIGAGLALSGGTLSATGGGGGGSMAIGGAITSATQGSLLFAGASGVLAQDNAKLFWDDANHWLGIGGASPQCPIDIAGAFGAGPKVLIYGDGGTSGYQSGLGVDLGATPNSMGFFIGNSTCFAIDAAKADEAFPYPSGYNTWLTIVATDGRTGVNNPGPGNIGAQLHVVASSANGLPALVAQSAGGGANIQEWRSSANATLASVRADGSVALPTLADAAAADGSLYFSSTTNKLTYKDSTGTLHAV